MSYKNHQQHKDAKHDDIVSDLRRQRVDIVELFKPLDLLGKLDGFVGFIEIKSEGSTMYTRPQIEFMGMTTYPVCIAKNSEQAIRFMKTQQGLTDKQKAALLGFLVLNKGKQWNHQQIERIIEL